MLTKASDLVVSYSHISAIINDQHLTPDQKTLILKETLIDLPAERLCTAKNTLSIIKQLVEDYINENSAKEVTAKEGEVSTESTQEQLLQNDDGDAGRSGAEKTVGEETPQKPRATKRNTRRVQKS